MDTETDNPWYKKGLCFSCQKCGSCCSKQAGYVWLTIEDIQTISKYLNITEKDFIQKYTRLCYKKLSLKECLPSYDCIFLLDNQCRIYEVRPKQCKTFPWWQENLSSKESWENLKNSCPGVDKGSTITPSSIIEETLKDS